MDTITLNQDYSTTRLVTKKQLKTGSNPNDQLKSVLFLPTNDKRKGKGGLRTQGYFKKSYDKKPLITVVTVVYNGQKHLEQTIKSVIEQSYDNVEYIIIDGGSTDGTLEIIKKYDDQIDCWVSEPDSGIYDAMNKGIKLATGEYIGFLNADDWYEVGAIEAVASMITKTKSNFISAKIRIVDENSKEIAIRRSTFNEYGKNVHHQTSFINLDIHKQFPFNTKYKLAADKDAIVRMLQSGISTYFVNKTITNFREGGKGSNVLKYQIELFDSNLRNIGLFFAIKRLIINLTAKTLFRLFDIKR